MDVDPRAVFVDITNVHRWSEGEPTGKQLNDYPSHLSPWPFTVFEYWQPGTVPGVRRLETSVKVATLDLKTAGLGDDPLEYFANEVHQKYMALHPDRPYWVEWLDVPDKDSGPARWCVNYIVGLSATPPGKYVSAGFFTGALSEQGKFTDSVLVASLDVEHTTPEHLILESLTPVFYACSFANAKNVVIRDKEVPDKVVKKRERRGKPTVRYKILDIDPSHKNVYAGDGAKTGIKRAFHLCRGHFKTYSKKRPLFGKVSGTVFVPAHVRGSRKHGEVKKDYRILPPKEDK